VLTPDEVVERSLPRGADEARAAACFELGEHLRRTVGHDAAVPWWREAHRLHPANWTYKRQAWTLVTTPEGAEENDAAEAARLERLATVTPDEAKAAALAAQPGKASKVELESEDGNVVYDVEVTTSTGTVDLKIDAGNAKVLQTEKEDGEKHDDKGGDHEKEGGNESGPEGAEASSGTANG